MSDRPDPLLLALGTLEREDAREPRGAWEDVLAGRSPVAEVVEAAVDAPDERAALAAMFSGPVPEGEVDDLVGRTLAAWDAPPASVSPPATTEPLAPAEPPAGPGATVVIPLVRRRATWAAAASVLAVAAALLLWLPGEASRAPLADYDLVVLDQSIQDTRSNDPPGAVRRYRADSSIDWLIRPARAVGEAAELRVLARDADGRELVLTPTATRSPEGTLRVRGRLGAVLPLETGRWRLRFLVFAATPAATPADAAAALASGAATEPKQPLEVELLPAP